MNQKKNEEVTEIACELVDILDVAEIGVWELDLKTNQITVDKSYCKILGCPEKTRPIEMEDMKKIFYPEGWETMKSNLKSYLSGEKTIHSTEHKLKKQDGTGDIWVLARGRVAKCGKHSEDKMLGSIMDITERKDSEDALKRSEERYRYIFEHAADPIFNTDTNGVVVELNSAIEKTFGYSAKEIVGKKLVKLPMFSIKTKALIATKIIDFFLKEKAKPWECEITAKDNSKRLVSVKSTKIMENGKVVGIQSIIRDITKRRKVERILQKRNNELEKFYKMKLPDYSKENKLN